jgi:nucleoside-diphosphate-sugar epimerase
MKVLITGSSGLLGNLMTKSLIAENIPVVGLDIVVPLEEYKQEYFRFYNCCVTEKERINAIFASEIPTHVIHFASTLGKIRNRSKEYKIDILGSENILDISDKTNSVKQLIFSSSALAYGGNKHNPDRMDEACLLNPGKYRYGENKKRVEQIFSTKPVRKDLNLILIRICNVVGPSFNKPGSIVSLLLKWSWLPEFCRETRIQFLHEEDFVSVLHLIINDKRINGVFNVAPDKDVTVTDLVPETRYFRIPVALTKLLLSILWGLRLINFQPAGINCAIYPLILDSLKVCRRFSFRFSYTSKEAFDSTRETNKIPSVIII